MEHSPPPFFKTGPTPLARLLIFSALSLALLATDARFDYLVTLRQAASAAVYPLRRIADAPMDIARRVSEFFVTHAFLRKENTRLARENFADAAALQQMKSLQAENAQLRALLGARERVSAKSTLAEILQTGRDPFSRKIIIDKGLRDGIEAGQAVIDDRGVIGQVTRTYLWLAEVTLLTDKGQAVPVQNLRNGLRGVVFGTGRDGALELKFMPVNADLQNGDRLVTSGIDGTYPPGLPVAEISNIERDAAYMFARIICKPLAGVASHTHALVLSWSRSRPEVPPAEGKAAPKRRGKAKKGAS